MKIFLLSNTHFGYKNNDKKWLNIMFNYFENYYIPFLKKYTKEGDKLFHLGNLFFNSQNININTLNRVQKLFEQISEIIPVYLFVGYNDKSSESSSNEINSLNIFKKFQNIHIIDKPTSFDDVFCLPWTNKFNELKNVKEKYVFINFDYKKYAVAVKPIISDKRVYCGFYNNSEVDDNITIVGAPYQLSANNSDDIVFYIIDTGTGKELKSNNTYSPKFIKMNIKTEEEINNLNEDLINNNFVDVVLDNSLEDKKNKVNFLLSKFDFNSINYNEAEEIMEEVNENLDLDELINSELNNKGEGIIKEYNHILNIYSGK